MVRTREDMYRNLLKRYKENNFNPNVNRAIQLLSNDFFVPNWKTIKEEILNKKKVSKKFDF